MLARRDVREIILAEGVGSHQSGEVGQAFSQHSQDMERGCLSSCHVEHVTSPHLSLSRLTSVNDMSAVSGSGWSRSVGFSRGRPFTEHCHHRCLCCLPQLHRNRSATSVQSFVAA